MRISSKIDGDQKTPRIVVFRSNRYIYAQAIDDVSQKTIASFSSLAFKKAGSKEKLKKSEEAKKIGLELALILKEKKINKGEVYMIYGHTHVAKFSPDKNYINTGFINYGVASYVWIKNGVPRLITTRY